MDSLKGLLEDVKNGIKAAPCATVCTITRQEAEEALKDQQANRALNYSHVLTLAADMENDKWIQNGEAMSFRFAEGDTKPILIDGQHRLMALIKSKKPSMSSTVSVTDRHDAQKVTDGGRNRRIGDVLSIEGHKVPAVLGAALKHVYCVNRAKTLKITYAAATKPFPTRQALYETLENNPDIVDSVRVANHRRVITPSYGAALHYLVVSQNPLLEPLMDHYLEIIGEGAPCSDSKSPAMTVRKMLLDSKNKAVQTSGHLYEYERICLFMIGWQYFLRGKYVNIKPQLTSILDSPDKQKELYVFCSVKLPNKDFGYGKKWLSQFQLPYPYRYYGDLPMELKIKYNKPL